MKFQDDKGGPKLIFFAIAIIVIYLAFFNFNVPAAYVYTLNSVKSMFQVL